MIKPSSDGKIHSTVTVAGPETGRFSMSKYVDNTGVNAQTFPRDSIEIPEELTDIKNAVALIEELSEELDKEDKEEENDI